MIPGSPFSSTKNLDMRLGRVYDRPVARGVRGVAAAMHTYAINVCSSNVRWGKRATVDWKIASNHGLTHQRSEYSSI